MRHITIKLLMLSSYFFRLNSFEYLYPVTSIEKDRIFYIYQKSLADLELWQLFLNDNHQEKCLDWRYIPAGLKILPDQSGFSFIDTGKLRIKKFIKRSCRTIEFKEPVYGISEVNWLDQDHCYFSAYQKDNFEIFNADIHKNELVKIYTKLDSNCLSPRIIDQSLFYIERNLIDKSCFISHKLLSDSLGQNILDCNYQQIVYLDMLSPELGWYVEHMPYINDDSEIVSFVCHKIELVSSSKKWIVAKLFKFNVLKKYLFGKDRLYESYLPFLPRAKKTAIYFADVKRNRHGEYYSSINEYDLINSKIEVILESNPSLILFAPILTGQELFYGKIWLSDLIGEKKELERISI